MRVRADNDVLREAQDFLRDGVNGSSRLRPEARRFLSGLPIPHDSAGSAENRRGLDRAVVSIESTGATAADNPVATLLRTVLERDAVVVRTSPADPSTADADVVISCAGWQPDEHWRDLDRRCAAAGVAWHRCHLENGTLRVGPMTLPGRGPRYADVRARRLAGSAVPGELRALWEFLDDGGRLPSPPWPGQGTIAMAVGLLAADVLAYLAGQRIPGGIHEQEVDGIDITRHPVLPLPTGRPDNRDCAGDADDTHHVDDTDQADHAVPVDNLIDPRFGVITRLERDRPAEGMPSTFVNYTAELANTREFAPWSADTVAGGAALADPERASAAAVGEAVERYCGNAVPSELIMGSAAGLRAQGWEALDPDTFALYSASQYTTPGFPFVPFTDRLQTAWVVGTDLHTGGEVLVPAALTYLNGPGARPNEDPAITAQAFAGIAAGPTKAAAEQAALEELVERDALTLWWYSGAPARSLLVDDDARIVGAVAEAAESGLRLTFLDIPCPFGVAVVGAFLEDPARGVVAFGAACRARPRAAAEKALTEALVTYTVGRALSDPGSKFWTAVGTGRLARKPYRAWRADRSYRRAFRPDWRDLTELDANVQLYLDPEMQGEPLRRLREPAGQVGLDGLPSIDDDPRRAYLDLFGEAALRAVSVDLTTPDVAATGLHVARIVVPGLYELPPAAFPLLGGKRLYAEPVSHGWVPGPLSEDSVVRHPLPFA